MRHLIPLLATALLATGCLSLRSSRLVHQFNGPREELYHVYFREPIPSNVTLVHAHALVLDREIWKLPGFAGGFKFVAPDPPFGYPFLLVNPPGGYKTELELLAPATWVQDQYQSYLLQPTRMHDWVQSRINHPLAAWYQPLPRSDYESFTDGTSACSTHMHVKKQPEPDGRFHIFFSRE